MPSSWSSLKSINTSDNSIQSCRRSSRITYCRDFNSLSTDSNSSSSSFSSGQNSRSRCINESKSSDRNNASNRLISSDGSTENTIGKNNKTDEGYDSSRSCARKGSCCSSKNNSVSSEYYNSNSLPAPKSTSRPSIWVMLTFLLSFILNMFGILTIFLQ